jgi:hypothetical protein
MEIKVLSASWIKHLIEYSRSRMPARLYVPLALLLSMAAMLGGQAKGAGQFLTSVGLAWTLVFQFRLWDDLIDLARDKQDHPDRVLCRAQSVKPFRVIAALLAGFNLAVLAGIDSSANDWRRSLSFTVLTAAMFLWYRFRDNTHLSPLGRSHIKLLKYPMFILLLSPLVKPEGTLLLVLSATLVYLCFSVFELLDQSSLINLPSFDGLLAMEMASFETVLLALFYVSAPRSGMALWIQSFVAGAAIIALIVLFRHRHSLSLQQSRHVFVIAFVSVLSILVGNFP